MHGSPQLGDSPRRADTGFLGDDIPAKDSTSAQSGMLASGTRGPELCTDVSPWPEADPSACSEN